MAMLNAGIISLILPTPTLLQFELLVTSLFTSLHSQCSETCILPHLNMEGHSFTLVVQFTDNKWDKKNKRTINIIFYHSLFSQYV